MAYSYEKYNPETGKIDFLPQDDKDGKVTGKYVMNVKAYFDENPEERKRLGWIKHIEHEPKEILDYDPQIEFIAKSVKTVDEYTIEDVLHVIKKSEDQLAFEEMLSVASWGNDCITFF